MVLTPGGSQAPITHAGTAPRSRTALQKSDHKGLHMLEGGEENVSLKQLPRVRHI